MFSRISQCVLYFPNQAAYHNVPQLENNLWKLEAKVPPVTSDFFVLTSNQVISSAEHTVHEIVIYSNVTIAEVGFCVVQYNFFFFLKKCPEFYAFGRPLSDSFVSLLKHLFGF